MDSVEDDKDKLDRDRDSANKILKKTEDEENLLK